MKNTLAVLVGSILLSIPSTAQNRPLRIMIMTPRATQASTQLPADFPELLRTKLITYLSKDCANLCTVVEPALDYDDEGTKVDAVLEGVWAIDQGRESLQLQGTWRLIAKDGTVMWSTTAHTHPFGGASLSSNISKTVSHHLVVYLGHR
jgi:hypothetical protein